MKREVLRVCRIDRRSVSISRSDHEDEGASLEDPLPDDSPLAEDALDRLQQLALVRAGLGRPDAHRRDLLQRLFGNHDERSAGRPGRPPTADSTTNCCASCARPSSPCPMRRRPCSAQRSICRPRQRQAPAWRRVVAELTFDSWAQPALARTIQLAAEGPRSRSALTAQLDALGEFRIDRVPPGRHQVTLRLADSDIAIPFAGCQHHCSVPAPRLLQAIAHRCSSSTMPRDEPRGRCAGEGCTVTRSSGPPQWFGSAPTL